MRKKGIILLLLLCFVLSAVGCKTKVVHCDVCGKDVVVKEKDNVGEDWIIYCDECYDEVFGDTPVVSDRTDE